MARPQRPTSSSGGRQAPKSSSTSETSTGDLASAMIVEVALPHPNPPGDDRSPSEPVKSAYGVPSGRLLTEPARLLGLGCLSGWGGEWSSSPAAGASGSPHKTADWQGDRGTRHLFGRCVDRASNDTCAGLCWHLAARDRLPVVGNLVPDHEWCRACQLVRGRAWRAVPSNSTSFVYMAGTADGPCACGNWPGRSRQGASQTTAAQAFR